MCPARAIASATPPAAAIICGATGDITGGNKNVIALLDQQGSISAKYAYSPFGKLLSAQGADAADCSFRFSSEYLDTESGLVYYNYRYYSPQLGHWLSRDPIGRRGGDNLYNFLQNNCINKWDFIGWLPGSITCTFANRKSDSGWVVKGYVPIAYVSAGSTGGGMSSGVTIIYSRKIVDNDSCKCTCPNNTIIKTRTRSYVKTLDYYRNGDIRWAGIPGPWPPLSLTDVITAIAIDKMTSGLISNSSRDREVIESVAKNKTPPATTIGDLVSDSGIPTRWCWWK